MYERVGFTENIFYIHTDYLGSWLAMTDGSGSLIARQSFDPWGRPRNPDTWELLRVDLNDPARALSLQPTAFFDRGYTGHEHMAGFGLINMNGRVYDPYLQRFISPDPYVQAPHNAQNYNRYAYCLNNPLMFTDPSGEFWHLVIGAAIGGTLNLIANWKKIDGDFWKGFKYFGVGAAAGALGAGVGAGISAALVKGGTLSAGASFSAGFWGTATQMSTGFAAGFVSGAAGGFSSGFLTGFGNAWVAGDNLSGMFNKGLDYGWKGAAMGGIAGGIGGGIDAVRNNKNFWTGADKQHGIIRINSDGTTDFFANTTKKDYKMTELKDCARITPEGDIVVNLPKNRITGISEDGLNIFNQTLNSQNGLFQFTSIDQVDKLTIYGWRWQHDPITSIRHLFGYGRPSRMFALPFFY